MQDIRYYEPKYKAQIFIKTFFYTLLVLLYRCPTYTSSGTGLSTHSSQLLELVSGTMDGGCLAREVSWLTGPPESWDMPP